VMSLTQE